MAYLSTNFPGNYYNGDESKALDFMGYFAHQQQQDQALKNQELNREMALEDLFHTRQMNPMTRQAKQLDIDTTTARLPGIKADSDTKVRDNELAASIPFEERRTGLLTKLAKETNEAELANEKAQIERFIINPTTPPQVRQQLIEVRNFMNDLYKHKQTLDSRETVAATRAAPRASGGGGKAKPPADRFALITKIANPFDKYTAYIAYANELDENHPDRARALAAAESIRSQAKTAADTRVSSGKWEKGADGKWKQSTTPDLEPQAPAPKAAAPGKSIYAKNPQTGERLVSTDGGKTWNPAK